MFVRDGTPFLLLLKALDLFVGVQYTFHIVSYE